MHPFFDNLIPEGWLLRHAEKIHKIDKENRFAILMATGHEPIGAVYIIPLDDSGNEIHSNPIEEKSSEDELYALEVPSIPKHCPYCLNELKYASDIKTGQHLKCVKGMWVTARKLKIALDKNDPLESFRKTVYGASISGAQKKGLFSLESGVLKSSTHRAPYILKPQGDYDQLPENEHVSMAVAKEIGFKIPEIAIFDSKIKKILAIKRFDLIDDKQARLEDFGQILLTSSEMKYESSNEKIAKALERYSDIPPFDLLDFWKRLLFCYLIGNADMHLKNWSLLEMGNLKGIFSLSPCYDFLNTRLAIPKEKIDIGLTINGKSLNLQWSYFRDFATSYGISKNEIETTREQIQSWFDILEKKVAICFLDQDKKETYLKISRERLAILLK